jgi:hypothetical protein
MDVVMPVMDGVKRQKGYWRIIDIKTWRSQVSG